MAQAPFTGTDVLAGVLGLLALLYLALWRRDREPGMGWFALAMALLGAWIFANDLHAPTAAQLQPSLWFAPLLLGIAALCVGLVAYLDVPRHWRTRVLAALLLPLLLSGVLALAVAAGALSLPRATVAILTTICFAGLAALAFWAQRREPGAGHGLVGAALLGIPGLAIVLRAVGSDSPMLRYWSFWPLLVLGLTLLTVSLLRRRRRLEAEVARRTQAEAALTALNATLEAEVARRTSELREMVAALDSFNRNVSHDLRGPLGGIGGLARLAEEALQRGDTAQVSRLLQPIAHQAEASGRLVTALLALAQAEDAPLQPRAVSLQALALDVAATLGTPAALSIGPLHTVRGDPDLLRAVLANLIGNALKFSTGRPDASVRVESRRDGDRVTLTVRDNGIGFDAAAANRLFQPFERLHDDRYEGHGVGLSIVRRVVERHGGSVQAEGRPGAGACFSVTLPA